MAHGQCLHTKNFALSWQRKFNKHSECFISTGLYTRTDTTNLTVVNKSALKILRLSQYNMVSEQETETFTMVMFYSPVRIRSNFTNSEVLEKVLQFKEV
jgi:hypothetical protein